MCESMYFSLYEVTENNINHQSHTCGIFLTNKTRWLFLNSTIGSAPLPWYRGNTSFHTETPDSRFTNSRCCWMFNCCDDSKTGSSNLRFLRCSCTALWISSGTDGPQSHSWLKRWSSIWSELVLKAAEQNYGENNKWRMWCVKVLTSQLQASPDAKVIDARKLASLILQLALFTVLVESSRGLTRTGRRYNSVCEVLCFVFCVDCVVAVK